MYTTLISVSELQALHGHVVVIDCSADLAKPEAGRQQFETQHIAGAAKDTRWQRTAFT